jgi:hypothetical protein
MFLFISVIPQGDFLNCQLPEELSLSENTGNLYKTAGRKALSVAFPVLHP